MKRLLITCTVMGFAVLAMALSAYTKTFNDKYHVKEGSALGKAKCAVCHTGAKGGKLNPYGKDIDAAMKAAGVKKMNAAMLTKVEGLDSDKDGRKNADEIKADKMPGAQ